MPEKQYCKIKMNKSAKKKKRKQAAFKFLGQAIVSCG